MRKRKNCGTQEKRKRRENIGKCGKRKNCGKQEKRKRRESSGKHEKRQKKKNPQKLRKTQKKKNPLRSSQKCPNTSKFNYNSYFQVEKKRESAGSNLIYS